MKHKILILGAGRVGSTVGKVWMERGHNVRYGVPDPDDKKYAALPPMSLQPANERRGAEVIVLATPYTAAASALAVLGDLSGAVIIDCTNPLGMGSDGLHLTVGFDSSGAETIASAIPGACLFKALNQTGVENMEHATAYPRPPVMFVAGDSGAHKPIVMQLVSDLGFEAVDAGPLRASRLLEPLAMLWIELALKRGQSTEFAISLVRRLSSSALQE